MRIKADPFKKVFGRDLSPYIKRLVLSEIGKMRDDLRHNYLDVTLVPAPVPMHSGHMIRVATNRNPSWYREIYGALEVKRDRIIASLERILSGSPSNKSSYDYMFLNIAKDRLIGGYEDEGTIIYPDNYVRVFLGLEPIEIEEPELEETDLSF
jgi:hypothetical protein